MTEIWKQISGIAGYQASDLGNIRLGEFGKPLSQFFINGYPAVCIAVNGEKVTRQVHRLVTLAFHGEPPSSKHLAAHINGVPTDNRAENLAWKTAQGNSDDRLLHLQIKRNVERIEKEKMKDRKRSLAWKDPFGKLPPTEQDWIDYDTKINQLSTVLCVQLPINDTTGKSIAEAFDRVEKPQWVKS